MLISTFDTKKEIQCLTELNKRDLVELVYLINR
jgi:hypothetical protein